MLTLEERGNPIESELVENNNFGGLDHVAFFVVFGVNGRGIADSFHHFRNIISGDLVILNDGTNLDLEDTVSNGLLLPFSLPGKTVHLDLEDLLSKNVEVSLGTEGLNIPDKDGLGNDNLTGGLLSSNSLGSSCLVLELVSGLNGIGFFIIRTEKIVALILFGNN